MGLDLTADHLRLQGLLLQDPRFVASAIDAALSTATQAGPIPGVPAAQQDSDLVVEAVGSQSADKALRLRSIRSGHPGTDEASFCWRNEGDTLWRGWDPPVTISDFEFIDYTTDTGAWSTPHAVTTPEGKIVVVAQAGDQQVSSWTRDPETGSWSGPVLIHDKGSAYTDGAHPCLVRLPSGRIVALFWRPVGTKATIRMHYSDDDGASWALGQVECLADAIPTSVWTPGRLRAAYLDGQVLLIASLSSSGGTPNHQLWQFASQDLAATFTNISKTDSGNSRVGPDVIAHNGKLFVAYVSYNGASEVIPYVRILGSAYEPFSSADPIDAHVGPAEWGEQTAGAFSFFELALYADEDDSLYIVGLDHDAAGGALREMMCVRSADGGDTWEAVSDSGAPTDGATLWRGREAAIYPNDFCAVAWRGCGVVIHGGKVGGEESIDLSESLMATFFGGWTTVCMPEYAALGAHELANRASWEHTWLPWISPDDVGYSYTPSAPAPTLLSSDLGRGISHTNAAHAGAWLHDITDGLDAGAIYLVEVNHDGNGVLRSEVDVLVSDGAGVSYGMGVVIDGTSIRAQDAPAGTATGAAFNTVSTGAALDGIQVLVAVSSSTGSAWWRPRGATDRAWSPIVTGATLSAGVAASPFVRIRTLPGASSGTAWFKLACFCEGTYTGNHLAAGQANPLDLLGRTWMPTPVYVDDGVSVYASDGPTYRPDEWNINTRYTYARENTDPRWAPSPQRGHRTLNDDSDADIVWKLGASTSDEHGLLGSMLALYLGEINWRTGELWARSGGTWAKLADIDAATGMTGLAFTRRGQSIHPNLASGSSAAHYFAEHVHAGSTWSFGSGTPRRIQTNTGGAWTLGSVGVALPPRLLLEDYDPADAASGSSGAIWSREVLVLVPLPAGADYDAFRLRIKAQTTADGDFRTGVAMLGWFLPFAEPYSAGRALGVTPLYDLTEGRNGVRSVRARGRNRRSVEFDWTDGVWTGGLADSPPHPDYIRAYTGSGAIIGEPAAMPWAMQGAYERARGAVEPVLYAASVPIGSTNAAITITDRARLLYGRIVSESFRLDAAEGDEWSDERPEWLRVNTVRIEEEL